MIKEWESRVLGMHTLARELPGEELSIEQSAEFSDALHLLMGDALSYNFAGQLPAEAAPHVMQVVDEVIDQLKPQVTQLMAAFVVVFNLFSRECESRSPDLDVTRILQELALRMANPEQ